MTTFRGRPFVFTTRLRNFSAAALSRFAVNERLIQLPTPLRIAAHVRYPLRSDLGSKLQHRFLAEAVGNDLQAPALLDEQPFQQVGRSRNAPIGDGQTQMGDARLEIVLKAGERARRDHGVVGGCRSPPRRRSLATALGSRQ